MYQWIQYLSEQDVEVLAIRDLCNSYFKMPSYLFSFEKLKSLSLTTCAVRIPSTFTKFNFLNELILRDISICDPDLARLICSCPLLENLILWHIFGLKSLVIHAPRLTKLMIDTGFEDLFIGAAPILSTVIITASLRKPEDRVILNWHSVIRCLSGLGSLESLVLSGDLIKVLAADYGLENFPLRNNAVKYLTINNISFQNVKVLRVCLSLLSSCHNIRSFRFSGKLGEILLSQLENVTFICPANVDMGCAVNFIEFVISQSPNLMFLHIQKGGNAAMEVIRVSSILQRFRWSCPRALLIFEQNG
ncbi:hypothetical protein RDABS01_022948, partial [Bienertia sinuspersici]